MYKIVLLGELGVGKTSIFRRLKDDEFDETVTTTTGIDSCTRPVSVNGQTVTVRSSINIAWNSIHDNVLIKIINAAHCQTEQINDSFLFLIPLHFEVHPSNIIIVLSLNSVGLLKSLG